MPDKIIATCTRDKVLRLALAASSALALPALAPSGSKWQPMPGAEAAGAALLQSLRG